MNKPISGAVPFGYNYDKLSRTIHTDEVERKIVRMIFELYLDGKGVNLIANDLNKAELFGRRTHRWASATISNILSSDRLRFYRGYDQNGIRGNWESLLTEDEYRFISDKREKNKSKKPSLKKEEKEKYLLTSIGVMFCGYCGGRIKSSVSSPGGVKKYYYYCSIRQSSGVFSCSKAKLVPMNTIDELVISKLNELTKFHSLDFIAQNIKRLKNNILNDIIAQTNLIAKLIKNELHEDPLKTMQIYSNKINMINKSWEDFNAIKFPTPKGELTNQEFILNNIEKIILNNDAISIYFYFPVNSSLNNFIELKF